MDFEQSVVPKQEVQHACHIEVNLARNISVRGVWGLVDFERSVAENNSRRPHWGYVSCDVYSVILSNERCTRAVESCKDAGRSNTSILFQQEQVNAPINTND